MTILSAALLLSAILGAAPAAAPADPNPLAAADMMDEVVVSADRSEATNFLTARQVDVLEGAELTAGQPDSLPEALASQGYFVQKTNAGAGAPIIRGQIGMENLVLVDGVRFNQSTWRTGPLQYLALLDPYMMSRVEVLHGPGSVLYGSDAMGGVIQALTSDPRAGRFAPLGGRLIARGGSAARSGGGLVEGSFVGDRAAALISLSGALVGDLTDGDGNSQVLSSVNRAGGRVKGSYKLADSWVLTGTSIFSAIDDAGRADKLGKGEFTIYDNQDVLSYVRASRKGQGLARNLQVNQSHHNSREVTAVFKCAYTDTDPKAIADYTACVRRELAGLSDRSRATDSVSTPGFFATWESSMLGDRLQTIAGAEGYVDLVSSGTRKAAAKDAWVWKDADRGNFSEDSSYLTLAAYLRAKYTLPLARDHRLQFSAGSRFTHLAASAADVPGYGDVEFDFQGLVGSAGLSYIYSDLLHLYFDWSQGFRAPNLQETTVMGNTGKDYEVPNADLTPMTSDTLEVGAKLHTALGSLGGAVYKTWVHDMIYRSELTAQEITDLGIDPTVLGTQKAYRRINVGSAEYKGLEARLETAAWSGLRLKASAAYVKGDVTDKDDKTQAATRVPPLSGSASLLFDDPWKHFVFAEAQVLWALKQDRLSSSDKDDLRICEDPANPGKVLAACKGTPGWAVINLRAGVRPFQGGEVTLGGENLLNEDYRIHGSGIDGAGLSGTLLFSMVL